MRLTLSLVGPGPHHGDAAVELLAAVIPQRPQGVLGVGFKLLGEQGKSLIPILSISHVVRKSRAVHIFRIPIVTTHIKQLRENKSLAVVILPSKAFFAAVEKKRGFSMAAKKAVREGLGTRLCNLHI